MTLTPPLSDWLSRMPLVAILRGLRADRASDVGFTLAGAGFVMLEVPLNTEGALGAVEALARALGGHVLVGAGTVLSAQDVASAADAGARLIVSPNTDPVVIAAARARGLLCLPGVFTPSEAFAALNAGADGLKLFPAEGSSPEALRALRTVIPALPILPVGGLQPDGLRLWWRAGASGFGIGSALYRPSFTTSDVTERAHAFTAAVKTLREGAGP